MAVIERPDPCGKCDRCTFAVEVRKMLSFVDQRLMPAMQTIAETYSDAKWRGATDRALHMLFRRYRAAENAWLEARAKILTLEVINAMTCAATLATIIIREPERPFFGETARPTERGETPPIHYPADHCIRCGAAADGTMPLSVCAACFGLI